MHFGSQNYNFNIIIFWRINYVQFRQYIVITFRTIKLNNFPGLKT